MTQKKTEVPDELLDNIFENVETDKGERHFARQFKYVYVFVRKSLVELKKSKSNYTNQAIVNKTKEVLKHALDTLE